MSISVLNTDAGLSATTLVNAESAQTVTGLKTYDRDPNAPFAVTASSAVVPNLDADKLDGLEATVFARWDGTGTPLGKIAFPAAQSASADANTLDDYEEGTWTPAITFATVGDFSVAYTTQVGGYTKVGKIVRAHFNIVTSSFTHTTAAGNFSITTFPFTSASTGSYEHCGALYFQGITLANYTQFVVRIASNATIASIVASGSAQTAIPLTTAHFPTGGSVILAGTVVYEASA